MTALAVSEESLAEAGVLGVGGGSADSQTSGPRHERCIRPSSPPGRSQNLFAKVFQQEAGGSSHGETPSSLHKKPMTLYQPPPYFLVLDFIDTIKT